VNDTLIIVNPASAGGRTGREWPRVHRCLLDAGVVFVPRITSASGDATRLTREALREGYARVVAVGGDGTLNEVVNGFFDPESLQPVNRDAVLGMIPSGTGGDFRKSVGIPRAHATACALLARGDVRVVDVGRIDYHGGGAPAPRWFVNIADCGIGGDVVHRVNRSRKAAGGTLTFLYHSLASLLTFGSRMLRVDVDGEVQEGALQNVVVANGRYFGGGMKIAPQASLEDGLFDVVLAEDLGRLRSLGGLGRLYRGEHLGRPGVTLKRGRVVTVTPLEQRPILFDVEGEQVGRAPATLTCLPGALRVCAPNHP
jgi:YegS/Rv2252/BmrU family lipid kinase